MLVTARACQGAFGALLAPAALSLLTTTFSDPKERGKAFGVYGAIAGGGGLVGLLLGGLLTEYLDWRWCLYVNLVFAGVAVVGAFLFLSSDRSAHTAHLDIFGVLTVSASMFCLVYGFSNAASHSWHTPSTWGYLAVGVALLVIFAWWQTRAAHPLLPPRVVLDRNRGGAHLAVLIAGVGMFGIAGVGGRKRCRGPGPDFSERDRALLTLLRPHLHQAYLDAERRRHPVPELTPRQTDLLHLLAAGHANTQIARRLGLSEGTVRTHLENIYGRLQVSSRTAAVARAFPNRDA